MNDCLCFQGKTLHFNCEYEIDDGDDSTDEEESQLFSITDVGLLLHPDADHTNIYHCETENMDYVSVTESICDPSLYQLNY